MKQKLTYRTYETMYRSNNSEREWSEHREYKEHHVPLFRSLFHVQVFLFLCNCFDFALLKTARMHLRIFK